MANFLAKFVDLQGGLPHASYDLWEQRFGTHSYSVALTIAALEHAATLATTHRQFDDANLWQETATHIRGQLGQLVGEDGTYLRSLLLSPQGDVTTETTVDIATAYGFGFYLTDDSEHYQATLAAVEAALMNAPGGGVARYVDDNYFRSKPQYTGNPWIVCSLWLAQLYLKQDTLEKAEPLLDWALSCALESGSLPEQVDPENKGPIGVAPLVWSHAEFLRTALMYSTRKAKTPTVVDVSSADD